MRHLDSWTLRLGLALVGAVACGGGLTAQKLLDLPQAMQIAYDGDRDLLYVSNTTGTIVRYDPYAGGYLEPLRYDLELAGMDVAVDGRSLFAAVSIGGLGQSEIVEFDLTAARLRRRITYAKDSLEAGAWDLAVFDVDHGLIGPRIGGSGPMVLREFSPRDATTRRRTDYSEAGSWLRIGRDAGRKLGVLRDSSRRLRIYDAVRRSFAASAELPDIPLLASIAPGGDLVAVQDRTWLRVYDVSLRQQRELLDYTGGHAFAPDGKVLYSVFAPRHEIRALDTTTWSVLKTVAIGEPISASVSNFEGSMVTSADGARVFLRTRSGVRVYELAVPRPKVLRVAPDRMWHSMPAPIVEIEGFALGGEPRVYFGTKEAGEVAVVSVNRIRCRPPAADPGSVDIRVTTTSGSNSLPQAFHYAPVVVATLDDSALTVRCLIEAGDDVLAIVGLPPQVQIPTPPFAGVLCIRDPLPLLIAMAWPLDEISARFAVPAGLRSAGVTLLLQSLSGPLRLARGRWSPCVEQRIY
jgi:hypothetical protein